MMYSFNVSNVNIDYQRMIEMISTSVKYTSQIVGEHGYADRLRQTIYGIITNKRYNHITRSEGLRNGIMQYVPDDFVNLICSSMVKNNELLLKNLVIKNDGKYYISQNNLEYLVNYYCQNELLPIMESLPIQLSLFEKYRPEYNNLQPQNVQYYRPSNECRRAVLGNFQIRLLNSSACGDGMYAYSDVGKYRKNQEDSYYIGVHPNNSNFKIMIVADGMGGEANGEVASNTVVKEILLWFEQLPGNEFYTENNQALANALQTKIIQIHKELCNTILRGGTTLCLSIIKDDSILVGNIGDSKGYIIKDDNLIFMTEPENVPNKYEHIPEPFARYHDSNNVVLSCIGPSYGDAAPVIDFSQIKIKKGSNYKVILCSDGVVDCITNKDIVDIANTSNDPARQIVEMAIANDSYLQDDLNKANDKERRLVGEYIANGSMKNYIPGGKDNTTAVVAEIENGRHR